MRQDTWDEFEVSYPVGYKQKTLEYGQHELQKIHLSIPAGKKNFPLIIWFHGGGLSCDLREFPRDLWNGEYASAEVRYRLSDGNFKGTDSLADAAQAVSFILKELDSLNADPQNIFLGGMSAGAYLAAMVGMNPALLAEYGEDNRKFKGLLIVSGQMTTHFQLKKDLNYASSDCEPVIDKYAPLYYAAQKFAPILLITGESGLDMPGRPEENAFLAATLKALGHPCVQCYNLPGHDHLGAFNSCDHLILRFMENLINASCV